MFKHNLLITFRNLQKHKASFFINLAGLSTGLACTLLIYLWVNDEMHFDHFHAKDSRLYQVMELSKENNNVIVHEATQGLLAASMLKDLPEVEAAVPVMNLEKEGFLFNVKTPDKNLKASGMFAGSNFFDVFSFPLLNGLPQKVLAEKNGVVISEALAKNLYGSVENAAGKTMDWEVAGMAKGQVQVAGVFAALPSDNSMKFDFVLTYDLFINELWKNGQSWNNEGPSTYLVLKPGTNVTAFDTKIKDFVKKYREDTQFSLFTRRYSSAYLHGNFENGVPVGGRIGYVKLFSVIALFILAIACINFMNLSTARASRRLKEVGIKKAVGSTRQALILQFLTESVFISLLSLLIALVIVLLFLPTFNQLTGKEIQLQFNAISIAILLGVILLTGIISGSYPAFYLSGFKPVAILKGKIKNSVAELLARKGLVVFQFMVSLVLIVAVIIIYQQMNYLQTKSLGYDRANVIQFDKEGIVTNNTRAFLDELKQLPGIVNATAASQSAVQNGNNGTTYGIDWPGKTEKDLVNFVVRNVDYDMFETLGIQAKEGRFFSKQFGADSTKLIFNEAAIKVMGLKNAVGTKVKMWNQDMEIAGVVKDFHIASLHEQIAPMVFRYDPSRTTLVMAKLAAGKEKETLAKLEHFYKTYNPGYPFNFKFLDHAYQALYVSEQRVAALSKYFAGLAILISCLGLFGLATFNAEVRTKEIGIRKVLGASAASVMYLLSKDFFKLVLIAVLIAFPLAWWAMKNWLDGFAYKINIGATVFLVAFAVIVLLTALTVSFQAIKSAFANPVNSLRTE